MMGHDSHTQGKKKYMRDIIQPASQLPRKIKVTVNVGGGTATPKWSPTYPYHVSPYIIHNSAINCSLRLPNGRRTIKIEGTSEFHFTKIITYHQKRPVTKSTRLYHDIRVAKIPMHKPSLMPHAQPASSDGAVAPAPKYLFPSHLRRR